MDKKILLITFSDNADHQDITLGMYEELYPLHEVWTICIKNSKVVINVLEHVKFVDCPKRPGICKKTFDIKTLMEIVKWIKKQNFEVIFFETLHVWNLPIMLFCHKNTRIFQMIHDLIPHEGDKQAKAVNLMNKVVCKLADMIVLCNQKYVPLVTKLYHVPPSAVRYIDMWRRFPKYSIPRFTGRVLFFGRINPYKGADNLLRIVRACPEIQFDVVGRVDEQMQEIVTQLGNEKNVIMNNDYVTDAEMEQAFINADWVILPYNSATQSGVVVDAYRYSRPVIAFDVGALSEQVSEGKSGYLIPAGNIDKFIDKLKDCVLMNREEYKNMCQYAYTYGSKKYAASGAQKRFEELIENEYSE